MIETKFYIYFHINPLKNEVFYVGRGHNRRAWERCRRNNFWKNENNKYGFIVDIVETNMTMQEANEKEIFYIKKIGRRDLGLGTLVNLTNGGDGGGRKWTQEQKDKLSNTKTGTKLSKEHVEKLSQARLGKEPWNKGTKGLQKAWNKGLKKTIITNDTC